MTDCQVQNNTMKRWLMCSQHTCIRAAKCCTPSVRHTVKMSVSVWWQRGTSNYHLRPVHNGQVRPAQTYGSCEPVFSLLCFDPHENVRRGVPHGYPANEENTDHTRPICWRSCEDWASFASAVCCAVYTTLSQSQTASIHTIHHRL